LTLYSPVLLLSQQAPLGLTDFMERKATRNKSDLFPEPSATQRMRKLFPTFADM